jgi:hypothetical protein
MDMLKLISAFCDYVNVAKYWPFYTCWVGGYGCSKQALIHIFQMECCGNNNYTDWGNIFHNDSLPLSCCLRSQTVVGFDNCTTASPNRYLKGCLEEFGAFVMKHAAVLGGVGIGIAFVQVK